jgi:flagellar assembly protein FliH
MSGIIKSDNPAGLVAVRPLAPIGTVLTPITRLDEERERFRTRIESLESEARKRDLTIGELRRDIERVRKESREEGFSAGLSAAEDREESRLALLKAAISQTKTELTSKLASLDRLAPLLAQDCLELIFGDASARAEEICSILRRHLKTIEKSAVLAIEVSRLDFSSESVLRESLAEMGFQNFAVNLRVDAPSGHCTIRLRLGQLEVGVKQQWGLLNTLLGELAIPGERE